MSVERDRHSVIRLFDDNIFPQIIGDLNELDKIQPTSRNTACAVPTAMLVLSTLEFIGYLLKRKGRSGASFNNIKFAIKYGGYFPSTYSNKVIEDLVLIYRNGMMHTFFPSNQKSKQIYGIHKSAKSTLFENKAIKTETVKSLNVNVLSEDFRNFVFSLKNEITTTSDGILLKGICDKFKTRYDADIITTSTTTTETTMAPGVIY